MTSKEHVLLTRAAEQFPDLTDAERKLLHAVITGEVADYRSPNDAENDPQHAETWGVSRTIRAPVIRWLCVDRNALLQVDPRGLQIEAAKIQGSLDLTGVTVPFPFALRQCDTRDGINLRDARTCRLDFQGSYSGSIAGKGLGVSGDVLLGQGFRAVGGVSLCGATITGDLNCRGGRFLMGDNYKQPALDASQAKIGGNVVLSNGFQAEGEVRLFGATIGGNLECQQGHFLKARSLKGHQELSLTRLNKNEIALYASHAKVGSHVFLSEGFQAEGQVRLIGMTIGGDLDCQRGYFHNKGEIVLHADHAKVGGHVYLRRPRRAEDSFRACGEVGLYGTTIEGNLDCRGGRFCNPGKIALNADRAHISGHAMLSDGFRAAGLVRLVGSSFGLSLDFRKAQFSGTPQNGVIAEGMTVAGILDWRGVTTTRKTILNLSRARVGQLADAQNSWPEQEKLGLDGFVYTAIHDGPMDAKTRTCWLKRQKPPFRPQPYQQLAKVLRESGHEADAKWVLIAKERARRTHGDLGWVAWCGNWLLDVTIRYDYQPWRALIWAGVWVVIGGGLFGWGYDAGIVIPTKAEAYDSTKTTRQEPPFYPAFNRWLYALDTFVPIINFGEKDYWAPQVACNKSGLIRGGGIRLCVLGLRALYFYKWLHIVAGWVLITLVVTGFTNLVRRE